jgi:ATP synthase F1 complex assembly factor 2
LHRRQEQAWKSLHGFVEERFDHAPAFALGASEGILMARKRGDTKPSAGLPHPPNLVEKAKEWTYSLDAWHLGALSSMTSQAKSFLVGWAILEPGSPLSEISKAMEASRVEEEFQISSWGLVEGGHDYDRLNCSIQLHSAQLFAKTIAMDNQLDP